MTTALHPAHPEAAATIEAIRTARLVLKLAVVDLHLIVTAHRDEHASDEPLATAVVPLVRHPGSLAATVAFIDYPGPANLETFREITDPEVLAQAVLMAGETAVAAVVGVEDYLAVARRVRIHTFRGRYTVSVYRLRRHQLTGLVDIDSRAGVLAELQISTETSESLFTTTELTWPRQDAGETIPDLSHDPVLGSVLRHLAGAA